MRNVENREYLRFSCESNISKSTFREDDLEENSDLVDKEPTSDSDF